MTAKEVMYHVNYTITCRVKKCDNSETEINKLKNSIEQIKKIKFIYIGPREPQKPEPPTKVTDDDVYRSYIVNNGPCPDCLRHVYKHETLVYDYNYIKCLEKPNDHTNSNLKYMDITDFNETPGPLDQQIASGYLQISKDAIQKGQHKDEIAKLKLKINDWYSKELQKYSELHKEYKKAYSTWDAERPQHMTIDELRLQRLTNELNEIMSDQSLENKSTKKSVDLSVEQFNSMISKIQASNSCNIYNKNSNAIVTIKKMEDRALNNVIPAITPLEDNQWISRITYTTPNN